MNQKELLIEARKRLAIPGVWIKGALAHDAEGVRAIVTSDSAVKFCAVGMCLRVAEENDVDWNSTTNPIVDVMLSRKLGSNISAHNDRAARTLEEMLELFDAAILSS